MIFYTLLVLSIVIIVYLLYQVICQVSGISIFLTLVGVCTVCWLVCAYVLDNKRIVIYDTIVIGSGLSGLRVASNLTSAGQTVCVLEARDRVGGKAFTRAGVDHGGQWIGKHHHKMLDLIRMFGLRVFKSSSEFPLDRKGKFSILWKDNQPLRVNSFRTIDLNSVISPSIVEEFRSAVEKVRTDPKCTKSLREWMEENMRDESARALFDVFWTNELAVSANDIRVQDLVDQMRMNPVEDQAEVWRVRGGIGQIVRRMANRLTCPIHLNEPVSSVRRISSNLFQVQTCGSSTYQCRRVVFAIAPHLLHHIRMEPALVDFSTAAGCVVKIHITYDRPFWRRNGWNGYAILPFSNVINSIVDNSTDDKFVLCAFCVGDTAKRVRTRRAVLDEVAKVFGPSSYDCVSYEEYNWCTDPWTRGGWQSIVKSPITVPSGMYLVGADYSPKWNGFFEGALISADQVSRQICNSFCRVDN